MSTANGVIAGRPGARGLTAVLRALVATEADGAVALGRIVLGLVMLPHGLQKTLGWFGGYGFTGTMGWFAGTLGVPAPLAFLVILAESLGAVALIVGAFGRVQAFGIAATMLGAALAVHARFGFFMNWFGNQQGEGYEYHLLAAALAAIVMLKGSGAWSVDRLLATRARP